jgi:hypothetical protein
VKITLREQFYNHSNNKKRCLEFSDRISSSARPHGLAIANFYGADGAYNDSPFLPAPALNSIFEGAEIIMNNSGHAFQEPLQLLNAEFCWNSGNNQLADAPFPKDSKSFTERLSAYKELKSRPVQIFKNNGFLERACKSLYGKAGGHIADIFRLTGKNNEHPVPYIWNFMFETSPFQKKTLSWGSGLNEENLSAYIFRFREIIKLNRKSVIILKTALMNKKELTVDVINDIIFFEESYKAGITYGKLFFDYSFNCFNTTQNQNTILR